METAGRSQPRIYTTPDGRAVIEQSGDAKVALSAEQILIVINELRACYDYCATWRQSPPDENGSTDTEARQ